MTAPAVTEATVREELDAIVDPCSAVAGAPAGLVSMGVVRDVRIRLERDGAVTVAVTIGVTEPTCLMGWPFAREAEERLGRLPGVRRVEIRLDNAAPWTPELMTTEYRERLRAARGHYAQVSRRS